MGVYIHTHTHTHTHTYIYIYIYLRFYKNLRINKFSKVPGYKVNTQKSVAILYITNNLSKKEIKKTIYNVIKK